MPPIFRDGNYSEYDDHRHLEDELKQVGDQDAQSPPINVYSPVKGMSTNTQIRRDVTPGSGKVVWKPAKETTRPFAIAGPSKT